jgi:hypothetical protein
MKKALIVTLPCAFCGREIRAVDGTEQAIMHIRPECRKFIELDPVDFLAACRAKAESTLPQ